MQKSILGAVGGASVGYVYFKKQPLLGAAIGFFVGRFLGDQLDKSSKANAERAAVQQQIDSGTAF